MKIPLSKGFFAEVDAADFEWASQFNWFIFRPVGAPHLVYARRKVRLPSGNYSNRMMHRELLGITDPTLEVDHWDRNGINNRRKNLRVCSTSQNQANSRQHRDAGTSQFKGVTRHKKAWQAQIQFRKKRIYLGRFAVEELAAKAYADAAHKLFGTYARLK